MYIKPFILISTVLLLNACTTGTKNTAPQHVNQAQASLSQQRDINLKQQVHVYTEDQSTFNVAFNDLNQDGIDDAIVLLNGQNWCGSGGCTILIFKGKADQQFELLSKTTLVDRPVYATTYTQNGWKQLLVYSRKHGQVMLKYDGKQYPLNPSLLPVETAKLAPDRAELLFGEE
ncbi:MAG: hypothetical protein GAK29_04234 [Acinetobacter bereziniae]|uniref:Lipoprotein n=1 Tax=Acinetobacter bereziniae TaxID=106648 RepID=A0A833UNB1_ACIBZ|nr:MAG: hypothetical protein GAK29_04234 [Acinetobacter bereziniae]